jgi:hypothetical protein
MFFPAELGLPFNIIFPGWFIIFNSFVPIIALVALYNWPNEQQSQVIRIDAKYRQMTFRLVHLPEILEELFGSSGPTVTDAI